MNIEKLKQFKFEIKIFLWYLITEPFRFCRDFFKIGSRKFGKIFNKQTTWLVIYLGLVLFIFLTDSNKIKWAVLILLFVAILRYEWKEKRYIKRWRDHYKKVLEKKYGNSIKSEEGQFEDINKEK